MELLQKLPWSQPRFVDHEVDGQSLRFYQITGFKLIAIKDTVRVLIDSLMQLQRSPREDAGSKETRDMERTELDTEQKMKFMPKTLTVSEKSAVGTDLAAYHDSQRRQALKVLVDQVMDQRTYKDLVGLIVSSLRDEFPTAPTKQELDAIVESMPLPTLIALMGGVLKANTGVFGPLEGLVLKAMDRLRDRLEKIGETKEEDLEAN